MKREIRRSFAPLAPIRFGLLPRTGSNVSTRSGSNPNPNPHPHPHPNPLKKEQNEPHHTKPHQTKPVTGFALGRTVFTHIDIYVYITYLTLMGFFFFVVVVVLFSLFTQSYPNVITHILEPYHPNPNLKSLPLSRTHTQIYNTHPHPNLQHPPTPRSTTPTITRSTTL